MLPLFDMLNNAQNGQAFATLAQQFGLSQAQAQAAVEALLPAFSQGLKRNAADPYGFGALLTQMASGNHARYFEDAASAFSAQGVAEGNSVLGQLFGSKDLSRAVAAQASAATGIGQEIVKQMLPVIASMIMGGLFKQSAGQVAGGNPFGQQAGGFGAGGNPLAEMIEQMMKGGGMGGFGAPAGGPSQAAPGADPFDNPFGKMLKDMMGGGMPGQPAPQPAPRQPNPQTDNPLGRMFEEMMGGRRQASPEPEQPDDNPSGPTRTPYDDIFGKMFETGAKQRDDYQKGVESIFEQFTKGMDRHR